MVLEPARRKRLRRSTVTRLNRVLLSVVIVVLMASAFASAASAAPTQSPPRSATTICNNPVYRQVANDGWHANGTYQIAAILWAQEDGNNFAYCDHLQVGVGIQFLATNSTCGDAWGFMDIDQTY